MGKAVAKAVIRADNRKLRGDLRKSKSMFGKAFKGIGRGIKGSLGAVLSPLGAGVGALGFAAIGKEVLDFEQVLTDLEIQGGASAETMLGLRGTIDQLSAANALGKGELSALALEMVNLEGKAGLNADKLKVLADAAFATSAPVEELAGLSLALGNSFALANPAKLKAGLDAIITAGKEGSIPLAEMNLLLQQNGAQFSKFSGEGVASVTKMAATLQGLRKDFGTAGEAGTALGAIMGVFQTREVELRKAGIEVKKSNGEFRELADIVGDINMSGIVDKAEKFKKAFGSRKEARLALDSMIKRKALIDGITEASKESNAIDLDGAKRRESESFKIKKSFNDIKLTIMEAFTPARIKKFASAMESLSKVVGFIADNITSFVLLLASIKISQLVGGFSSIAKSSGTAAANAGRMGGAMGKIGVAANLAGAAIAGWQIGKALDEALGISDAISDLALPTATEKKKFDTGFLREQAGKLSGQGREAAKGGDIPIAEQAQALNRARRVVFAAKDAGVIGAGGKIDRSKAFTAQTGKDKPGAGGFFGNVETARNQAATDQLVAAIKQAQALVQGSSQLQEQGVSVKISVDEKGLLKATAIEQRDARRAPQ